MKVLATFEERGQTFTIEETEDKVVVIKRADGTRADGILSTPFKVLQSLARQLHKANQTINERGDVINKRGDRVTLGSEWWVWEVEGKRDNYTSTWRRVQVMELRYQRDTVEVLGGGHRFVVKIDQLFKDRDFSVPGSPEQEEKLPMYGRDRLAKCGRAAMGSLHLDEYSDSPADVRQAICSLKKIAQLKESEALPEQEEIQKLQKEVRRLEEEIETKVIQLELLEGWKDWRN